MGAEVLRLADYLDDALEEERIGRALVRREWKRFTARPVEKQAVSALDLPSELAGRLRELEDVLAVLWLQARGALARAQDGAVRTDLAGAIEAIERVADEIGLDLDEEAALERWRRWESVRKTAQAITDALAPSVLDVATAVAKVADHLADIYRRVEALESRLGELAPLLEQVNDRLAITLGEKKRPSPWKGVIP